MESQLNAWKGEFGKAYTDRNNYDRCSRVSPWSTMLDGLSLDRIVEVGCTRGLHVRAIIEVLGPKELVGVEPNPYALGLARRSSTQLAFLRGNAYELPFRDGYFDLAFTCGVLIHVPLEMLPHAQADVARASRRYVSPSSTSRKLRTSFLIADATICCGSLTSWTTTTIMCPACG